LASLDVSTGKFADCGMTRTLLLRDEGRANSMGCVCLVSA